jgi:hypothetical protein
LIITQAPNQATCTQRRSYCHRNLRQFANEVCPCPFLVGSLLLFPEPAQCFLSAFGIITSHFRVGRHLLRASNYRAIMKLRFRGWEDAIGVGAIAN